MEEYLKCQFAVSGGGFLSTGFTADTQAWINVLFIKDDNQRHKTCPNSVPERETNRQTDRQTAWMTEHVLHQVKSYSWKTVCGVPKDCCHDILIYFQCLRVTFSLMTGLSAIKWSIGFSFPLSFNPAFTFYKTFFIECLKKQKQLSSLSNDTTTVQGLSV